MMQLGITTRTIIITAIRIVFKSHPATSKNVSKLEEEKRNN